MISIMITRYKSLVFYPWWISYQTFFYNYYCETAIAIAYFQDSIYYIESCPSSYIFHRTGQSIFNSFRYLCTPQLIFTYLITATITNTY